MASNEPQFFLAARADIKAERMRPWAVQDLHSDNSFRGWEEDEEDETQKNKNANVSPLRVTGGVIYRSAKRVTSFCGEPQLRKKKELRPRIHVGYLKTIHDDV